MIFTLIFKWVYLNVIHMKNQSKTSIRFIQECYIKDLHLLLDGVLPFLKEAISKIAGGVARALQFKNS